MKISAITFSSNYADLKTRKYNTSYKYTTGVSFSGKQIKTNKSIFAVFSALAAFLLNHIHKKKTEQTPIVDEHKSTISKDDEDRLKIIFTFVRPTVDENTITQNLPNGHVLEITKFPDRTIYFEYDNKSGRYVDKKTTTPSGELIEQHHSEFSTTYENPDNTRIIEDKQTSTYYSKESQNETVICGKYEKDGLWHERKEYKSTSHPENNYSEEFIYDKCPNDKYGSGARLISHITTKTEITIVGEPEICILPNGHTLEITKYSDGSIKEYEHDYLGCYSDVKTKDKYGKLVGEDKTVVIYDNPENIEGRKIIKSDELEIVNHDDCKYIRQLLNIYEKDGSHRFIQDYTNISDPKKSYIEETTYDNDGKILNINTFKSHPNG